MIAWNSILVDSIVKLLEERKDKLHRKKLPIVFHLYKKITIDRLICILIKLT